MVETLIYEMSVFVSVSFRQCERNAKCLLTYILSFLVMKHTIYGLT